MKEHLTAQEISRWLVEGPAPECEEHLRECGRCRAALAEARAPLSVFRAAMVEWSDQQPLTPVRDSVSWPGLRARTHFMNWAPAFGVAAAVAVLAAFLVRTPMHPKEPIQSSPVAQISDTALMDQVDDEVSETVPDAMAPLTDLVAWDADGSMAVKANGRQTAKQKEAATASKSVAD